MNHLLTIENLTASSGSTPILHGVSLSLRSGEVSAIMGPNGSGKSTLANILAGHPAYQVTGGSIQLGDQDLLALSPEQRSLAGVFLAFQYPASIPGVSVAQFLRLCFNAHERSKEQEPTGVAPFIRLLRQHMKVLQIPSSFAERSVNDGFSGGEKKRLEILQALLLKPQLLILDEIDSGLDIDALKTVSRAIELLRKEQTTILMITHYQRILSQVAPDTVHVMKEGVISQSGGPDLAYILEQHGYDHPAL